MDLSKSSLPTSVVKSFQATLVKNLIKSSTVCIFN